MRLFPLLSLFVWLCAQPAAAFETEAKAAILLDFRNGEVLFAKKPDQRLEPASMSKLMTALMVFEELERGTLTLDQELPVSERAWRMGGSRMFVEVDTRVTVGDLLKGIIVQSGNDACIVLAEALAGTEEAFAERMTARGKELGLENSTFKNATGWPNREHLTTVRDLALIARKIIKDYPQYYDYYSIKEFTYNDIQQFNRNPLLRANVPGVDGMKTGFTNAAGYGLVASAERNGRRVIMVAAGLPNPSKRRSESERLLEYGFRNFAEYRLFEAGDHIVDVPVWQGALPSVALVGADTIGVTLERAKRDGLKVDVSFESPVVAPIEVGQELGQLVVSVPDKAPIEMPLVAGTAVPRSGVAGRMMSNFNYLLWGTPEG